MRAVVCFSASIFLAVASLTPAADVASAPAAMSASAPASLPTTASAPAENGPKVPDAVLKDMLDMFAVRASGEMSPGEMVERNVMQMQRVISMGEKIARDYPGASNMRLVRDYMFKAARIIATTKGDSGPMEEIAANILASAAPLEEKIQVDSLLTSFRINPTAPRSRTMTTPPSRPQADAVKEIREFVGRYANTKGDALAALEGFALAQRARKNELASELLKEIKAKYLDRPTIRTALRDMCQHPDVGGTFQAELTGTSGEALTLPKDLAGKVVVVCFAAPTSSSFLAILERLTHIYNEYHEKGVEIVCIYENARKAELTAMLKTNKLPWINALTVSRESSPFTRYEILTVPAVWVLDREGKVVSDSALQRDEPDQDGRMTHVNDTSKLKFDVEQALKPRTPATTPATSAPSK